MSKLMSTNYSTGAFNLATLLLRLVFGILMIPYGYDKLIHFSEKKNSFMNLFGIGSATTLSLAIFAELLCAILIVLGLFSRFAAIPLVITMAVALFMAQHGSVFGKGQTPALFLAGFLAILIVGPGKISVDGMSGK